MCYMLAVGAARGGLRPLCGCPWLLLGLLFLDRDRAMQRVRECRASAGQLSLLDIRPVDRSCNEGLLLTPTTSDPPVCWTMVCPVPTPNNRVVRTTLADVFHALTPYALYPRGVHHVTVSSAIKSRKRRRASRIMEGILTLLLPVSPSATIYFPPDKSRSVSGKSLLEPLSPVPPYMDPVGTSMPRALELEDIVALVVDAFCPLDKVDRASLARLARVSSMWFAPAISRLYHESTEKSISHLQNLLPQPSDPSTSTQAYRRFLLYTNVIVSLRLHNWNHGISRYVRHGFNVVVLTPLHSLLELDENRPSAFLRLQHLDVEMPVGCRFDKLAVLLPTSLRTLRLSQASVPQHAPLTWSAQRDLEGFCYALSEWTPNLELFALFGRPFDHLNDAELLRGLRYLCHLRRLEVPPKFQVEVAARWEHQEEASGSSSNIRLVTSPEKICDLPWTESFAQLTRFEITITSPEDTYSIARMNALLVEQAPMLRCYSLLRTKAHWRKPFPIQPVASDFAPLAEASQLESLEIRIFMADDEFPHQGMDDHASVLLLIGRQCRALGTLVWDWPIASANLPSPRTLVDLASAADNLQELTIPVNLTFAHLHPVVPQPRLRRLNLATGTVYINQARSHSWISSLWPNATLHDCS